MQPGVDEIIHFRIAKLGTICAECRFPKGIGSYLPKGSIRDRRLGFVCLDIGVVERLSVTSTTRGCPTTAQIMKSVGVRAYVRAYVCARDLTVGIGE